MRLLLAVILSGIASTSGAEEIARCGPSAGTSAYLADGVLKRSGFSSDSTGELVLTRSPNGDYVLGLGDGDRTAGPVGNNGGHLMVDREATFIMAVITWPHNVETYIFTRENGKPVLMWTRNRLSGASSVGAYIAPCKFVKFADSDEWKEFTHPK
jgi:hypothetical protein